MESFHWPFLANVEIATTTIAAKRGDVWTKMCLDRWLGSQKLDYQNSRKTTRLMSMRISLKVIQ
jgi:hypothetical protein